MPRKSKKAASDNRIIVTLNSETIEQIDLHRTAKNPPFTRSAIVQAALDRYFDTDSDYQLLYRAFVRTKNQITELDSRQATLNEAFLLFVRVFLASTAVVDEDKMKQTKRLEPGRFQRYIDSLTASLQAGGTLTQKLEPHPLMDDDTLDQAE